MNKVLVFGMTQNPGGVENVIMNYYRKLDRNKIQFDFLCNTEQVAYEDEIEALGGKIYKITSRSENFKKYKQELKKIFKEHAKEYSSIWINVCSLANIDYLKYAKKYGIKKRIIHSHNSQNMDSFVRGLLHKFNRIFIKRYATDFWSCSREASDWFYSKKIIDSKKYLKVNNAIDVKKFIYNKQIREQYRKDLKIEERLVIGHVGRFHFQKNHEFLINVFEAICKIKDNAILMLIGIGPDEDKIKQMVKDKKLENNVLFLEVRNDVNCLMQAMDIFAFPSLFEGLPVTLVEAQTASLPVIASNTITAEIAIDKKKIKFLPINNEQIWVKEILKTAQNNIRKDETEIIQLAGYDIKQETIKLEKILM